MKILKKFKHWILAFALLGLAVLVGWFLASEPKQGSGPAVVSDQAPYNSDLPYTNSGLEETDDNFFIAGTFQAISDLKEPNKPTIVWISAPWCQVCKTMRPFIWQSANKYRDSLAFKEISFEDNYSTIVLPNRFFGTPTFLVISNTGELTDTFFGASENEFNKKLEEIISQQST